MFLLIKGWEVYTSYPDQPVTGSQTEVRAREVAAGEAPQCSQANQEVLESADSTTIGSDTESHRAFRVWITIPPETMTGWISYIEVLQKEVREGRSLYGLLECACTQFTIFQKEWPTQDWNIYLANLENEVKAGRTSMHLLRLSREMHACFMENSPIRDSQQDQLPNQEGPE